MKDFTYAILGAVVIGYLVGAVIRFVFGGMP